MLRVVNTAASHEVPPVGGGKLLGSEPDVPPGPRCAARPQSLMERAEPCALDGRGMLLMDKAWPVRLFAIGFLSPTPPTLSGIQRAPSTTNS